MISLATTKCRICGSEETRHHATMPSADASAGPVTFFVCDACETVFDAAETAHDYAVDGGDIESAWPAYQYHFEMSAGVAILAKMVHLAQSIAPHNASGGPRKFMDIGGGVGLTCEIAQRLGWDTVNFEPGVPGYFGERMLDVKFVHKCLTKGMLPEHSFDAIVSSEVIEHVPNPDEFISLIANYLTEKGVTILTTPNSAPVIHSSLGETELAESYSAGFHVHLFSAKSLEQLLRRNGFADVRVFAAEGTSGQKRLFAVACRSAGVLPRDIQSLLDEEAISQIFVDHLKWVIDRRDQSGRRDAWYHGACFRMVEHYVNYGEFEKAEPYIELVDEHLLERGLTNEVIPLIQAANFNDFMRQLPAYLGKYCFFRGVYELNYKRNTSAAKGYFQAARHVCAMQEDLVTFIGQFSLLARFHEGIACLLGGEAKEAIHIFDELERHAQQLPHTFRKRIRWERAVACLHSGQETAALGQFAAMAMEQFDFIKPEMREPLQHILMACAQRVETVRTQFQNYHGRLDTLVSDVAANLSDVKSKVASGVERVDRLTKRGAALASHVQDELSSSSEQLNRCLALGAELGRDMQTHVRTSTQRVGGLLEHTQGMAVRLEPHVREGATQLGALASRSLDIAQKIETGLLRANDTSLRVQQFIERNQEPAREIANRCGEIFAAMDATARSVQRTADFLHRGIASVGAAVTLPARVARRAWRAVGLPSKRVSVRRVGKRDALEFEGRIPLGEIVPGIVIEQSIQVPQNGLSAVALSFGTCQRPNHCTLRVAWVNGQNEVVRETAVDAQTLSDNRPYRVDFMPIADSAGKTYRVRVSSSDASPGNAVTVWARLTDASRGLAYNGKPIVDGELMLELSYSNV